jgi:hypothetical protein
LFSILFPKKQKSRCDVKFKDFIKQNTCIKENGEGLGEAGKAIRFQRYVLAPVKDRGKESWWEHPRMHAV